MGREFLGLSEIIVRVSANPCGVPASSRVSHISAGRYCRFLKYIYIYTRVLELKNVAYSTIAKSNTAIMLEDYKMILFFKIKYLKNM